MVLFQTQSSSMGSVVGHPPGVVGDQPVDQQASQGGNQPADQQAGQGGGQPADQQASQGGGQPPAGPVAEPLVDLLEEGPVEDHPPPAGQLWWDGVVWDIPPPQGPIIDIPWNGLEWRRWG